MLDDRKTFYADDRYWWALECTHVTCAKCGIIVAAKVGLDARMHDVIRFKCHYCYQSSVVPIVSRGTWTSPGHGPPIVVGVLVNDEFRNPYGIEYEPAMNKPIDASDGLVAFVAVE